MQTIHDTKEPATMPHDSSQPKKVEDLKNDLKQTKLRYGAAYTKLILSVKKLEHKVKASKSRRRTKIVDSDDEEIQEDTETQGRTSADIEILLEQEEPTELVEDPGSGEKGEKEISNAEINKEERQRIARDVEIAKQLQEEIDIARQEQEKYDLAQALELQKQLDEREEVVSEVDPAQVIDWSDPVMRRYHAQQNRSFSKVEVSKNMCIYLKNQGGYKQSHFKGMSYEDVIPLFERVWDQNQSFVPKDFEIEKEEKKRESVRKKELKRNDLVKKKFSSTEPTVDREKVLWVELKRLFEPDDDDTLWKLYRYMHDPLKWRLYNTCGVHHVSTERGHDIFMLVEKDYPLTRSLMTVMLVNRLQVDESLEMANELLRKIFYHKDQELEVFERILSESKV
ncbi:hypothetical protein Tco_0625013 [Tanacetum coccineum]|uniref:Uncharacterized protein n=1 Tax=Tanacetum coccineum TaxID=301880 RepID=A0ABQ4WFK8_9ASTR